MTVTRRTLRRIVGQMYRARPYTDWLTEIERLTGWHRRTLENQHHEELIDAFTKGVTAEVMAERLTSEAL